jgi:acyl carrier protein
MDKLLDIFSKILDLSNSDISDQSSPDNVENWDSLKFMQLVSEVEFQFNLNLSIDEIVNLNTYADFRKLIESKNS